MSELVRERLDCLPGNMTVWPDQIFIKNGVEYRQAPRESYVLGDPELPIAPYRERLTDTIDRHPVTIVQAETGSGKSTNLPLILLETGRYDRIFMTQPTIPAARNISSFMSKRASEALGYDTGDMIRYWTSPEGNATPDSRIIVCTDGLLLRILRNGVDPERDIVIIDEQHKRNSNMDVDLALCHEYGIKTVISSATLDAERIAKHCSDARGGIEVPVINIPGRTFEVETREEEDFNQAIIKRANQHKNILNIVTGRGDTRQVFQSIAGRVPKDYTLMSMDGDQTPDEQQRCFVEYPDGISITSTNVAETSLTIPGIDTVVDGCYERNCYVDDDGGKHLTIQPCSLATSNQRKGRAGRTRNGEYVRAPLKDYPAVPLYIKGQLNPLVAEFDTPEILRADLSSLILRLSLDEKSLSDLKLLDKPPEQRIEAFQQKLARLGAVALSGEVTDIGKEIARLPLDPTYGRMLVEARQTCSSAVQAQMVAMLAATQVQGITRSEKGREPWRHLTSENRSDMLVQLDVFSASVGMTQGERARLGIINQRFNKALKNYKKIMERLELDPDNLTTPTASEREAIMGCIVAGCDQLFVRRGDTYTSRSGRTHRLPKSSVLFGNERLVVGTPLSIQHMRRGHVIGQSIIQDNTSVSIGMLEKFAPSRCSYRDDGFSIDKSGNATAKSEVYFDGVSTKERSHHETRPDATVSKYLTEALVYDKTQFGGMTEHVKEIYEALNELTHLQNRTNMELELEDVHQRIVEQIVTGISHDTTSLNKMAAKIPVGLIRSQIDEELRQHIYQNAPDETTVMIDDEEVPVSIMYLNNIAHISVPSHAIRNFPDNLPQLGDRQIKIRPSEGTKYLDPEEAREKYSENNRQERRGDAQEDEANKPYPEDSPAEKRPPKIITPVQTEPDLPVIRRFRLRQPRGELS